MFQFLKMVIAAYDCQNVEANLAIIMPVIDIVIGSLLQIADFPIVNSHLRVGKHTIPTRFHFDEHHCGAVKSYDIQVAMTGLPISLQDNIAFAPKIFNRTLFTPGSQFIMRCHNWVDLFLLVRKEVHRVTREYPGIIYSAIDVGHRVNDDVVFTAVIPTERQHLQSCHRQYLYLRFYIFLFHLNFLFYYHFNSIPNVYALRRTHYLATLQVVDITIPYTLFTIH